LIIIGAVLAATIRMEDAAFGRLPQVYRHIERPDCQILVGYAALRVILSLTAQPTTRRLCRSRTTAR
jgi:hypothetical protein